VWAASLLAACGGLPVHTSYDPVSGPIAAAYQAYSWLQPPSDSTRNVPAEVVEAIRRLTDETLAAKGYRLRDSTPDFLVGWHLTGTEPVVTAAINMYYGYTWGRWFPGGGVIFGGGYRPEIGPSTLVIDVVDGAARELIWRGMAPVDRRALADSTRRGTALREILTEMFRGFPPR
jgi:hypothetical protein